jgi:hypothetical protein
MQPKDLKAYLEKYVPAVRDQWRAEGKGPDEIKPVRGVTFRHFPTIFEGVH